jgi:hypothetical protein
MIAEIKKNIPKEEIKYELAVRQVHPQFWFPISQHIDSYVWNAKPGKQNQNMTKDPRGV